MAVKLLVFPCPLDFWWSGGGRGWVGSRQSGLSLLARWLFISWPSSPLSPIKHLPVQKLYFTFSKITWQSMYQNTILQVRRILSEGRSHLSRFTWFVSRSQDSQKLTSKLKPFRFTRLLLTCIIEWLLAVYKYRSVHTCPRPTPPRASPIPLIPKSTTFPLSLLSLLQFSPLWFPVASP